MSEDEIVWYVEGPDVDQKQKQIKSVVGEEPIIFKIAYFHTTKETAEQLVEKIEELTGKTVVKSKKNWGKILEIAANEVNKTTAL